MYTHCDGKFAFRIGTLLVLESRNRAELDESLDHKAEVLLVTRGFSVDFVNILVCTRKCKIPGYAKLGLGLAPTNLLPQPYLNDFDRRRQIEYSEECEL